MILGYVRVLTVEQNAGRQLEIMKKYEVEKIFSEKISAKDTNRPELQNILDYAREGDTIVVHDFSRLARSTKDLLNIVEQLEKKAVKLISAKEMIDSSTPNGRLMLTMIGAINEFERANLLERQRERMALAKSQGKYKGRKAVNIPNFGEYYDRYLNREFTKVSLAKELNISRNTLDKLIKEYLEIKNPLTLNEANYKNSSITELTEELKKAHTQKEKDFFFDLLDRARHKAALKVVNPCIE
ncbi:MAG: recombinase family protein [Sarcina sp.]